MNMTPAAFSAFISGDTENLIAASTPGGIERQEKEGQIEQSLRQTLPIMGTMKDKHIWESLGFVFGGNQDDLFVNVTFPPGWYKQPTDHSMWTDLMDDKGRRRASIFYKAAFYDRSARVSLERRYSAGASPVHGYGDDYRRGDAFHGTVTDCGNIIFKTEPTAENPEYSERGPLAAQAMAWLTEKFPDWENPAAYWD